MWWQRAEKLARYYAEHAVAVFAHIGTGDTVQDVAVTAGERLHDSAVQSGWAEHHDERGG